MHITIAKLIVGIISGTAAVVATTDTLWKIVGLDEKPAPKRKKLKDIDEDEVEDDNT